ncbi:MAG: hypothetical protein Q9225_006717 [Loekoesia sp. 1 TL-2023]
MAEFAAAASGAGLASLGIQCCKGLTTYYFSFKTYDEQIRATHEQIEVLRSLFEKLERMLSRNTADPAQQSYVRQVDEIIILCRGGLQKLQSVLEECQRIAVPNSPSARLRKIKSQALFPFKEQTLLTVRENAKSLQDTLRLALQVFQTDMEMEQKQNIANLAATSRNVEMVSQNTQSDIQAIAGPVNRMDTRFDRLLRQGEDTTTRLSQMQVQMRQFHDDTLKLSRATSDQNRLLLQQEKGSSRILEQDLITALGELGAERELLRDGISLLSQKRERGTEELAGRIDVLVRKVRSTVEALD